MFDKPKIVFERNTQTIVGVVGRDERFYPIKGDAQLMIMDAPTDRYPYALFIIRDGEIYHQQYLNVEQYEYYISGRDVSHGFVDNQGNIIFKGPIN